jgi:hypothetical protein
MGLSKLLKHSINALGIFLTKNGFKIGKADSTLFTKKVDKDLFIYHIYVDDITFGSTNQSFYDKFSKVMIDRFEMSMIGELKFFLGFQIKQLEDVIFHSQTKYTHDILKKFGMIRQNPSRLLWVQMDILILMWVGNWWIKRYTTSS